jgi:hypothetical protein
MTTTLKVGVASYEDMKARALAVAFRVVGDLVSSTAATSRNP